MKFPLIGKTVFWILLSAVMAGLLLLNSNLYAEKEKESPLEDTMHHMGKAFKQLGKAMEQPSDADRESNLKLVAVIKQGAEQAKNFVPETVQKMPVEEQKENVLIFKKQIDHLLQALDDLSKALEAGKLDEARTAFAAVKKAKAMGHEEFVKEEK